MDDPELGRLVGRVVDLEHVDAGRDGRAVDSEAGLVEVGVGILQLTRQLADRTWVDRVVLQDGCPAVRNGGHAARAVPSDGVHASGAVDDGTCQARAELVSVIEQGPGALHRHTDRTAMRVGVVGNDGSPARVELVGRQRGGEVATAHYRHGLCIPQDPSAAAGGVTEGRVVDRPAEVGAADLQEPGRVLRPAAPAVPLV